MFTLEHVRAVDTPCLMCRRRPTKGKSNPRGGNFPYLSNAGEHILDIKFSMSCAHLCDLFTCLCDCRHELLQYAGSSYTTLNSLSRAMKYSTG